LGFGLYLCGFTMKDSRFRVSNFVFRGLGLGFGFRISDRARVQGKGGVEEVEWLRPDAFTCFRGLRSGLLHWFRVPGFGRRAKGERPDRFTRSRVVGFTTRWSTRVLIPPILRGT